MKPVGSKYERFCMLWDAADHAEKVELCKEFGVSYATGRHWRSDGATPPKPEAPEVVEEATITTLEAPGEVKEFLKMGYTSKLDAVSFDLETTNFTADFSIILCGCIKPYGADPITFRADEYPAWDKNRSDDGAITRDIAQELSKHALVITHYGSRFDIPYLRGKLVGYGIPNLPPMFGLDTYSVAKANFKLSRRRLETLAEYLGLGEKSGVVGKLWLAASLGGNREAMNQIVKHCQVDVAILERLAEICFPYVKSIRKL